MPVSAPAGGAASCAMRLLASAWAFTKSSCAAPGLSACSVHFGLNSPANGSTLDPATCRRRAAHARGGELCARQPPPLSAGNQSAGPRAAARVCARTSTATRHGPSSRCAAQRGQLHAQPPARPAQTATPAAWGWAKARGCRGRRRPGRSQSGHACARAAGAGTAGRTGSHRPSPPPSRCLRLPVPPCLKAPPCASRL